MGIRLALLITLMVLPVAMGSPERKTIYIEGGRKVDLTEILWKAVCKVESGNRTDTVNQFEGAYGIAQIRECKLKDFNLAQNQNNGILKALDSSFSLEVFRYHSREVIRKSGGKLNPEAFFELSAKSWNGGWAGRNNAGEYWEKIKNEILNNKYGI